MRKALSSSPAIFVFIVAGGQSSRMRGARNKCFLTLAKKCLLEFSLEAFLAFAPSSHLFLSAHKDDAEHLSPASLQTIEGIFSPRENRMASISHFLHQLSAHDEDLLFIHDGARPFLRKKDLFAMQAELLAGEAEAVTLATPCVDSIVCMEQSMMKLPLNRSSLAALQTPILSQIKNFRKAHAFAQQEHSNRQAGDEDSAWMIKAGMSVKLLLRQNNQKITHPEDLLWAEQKAKKWQAL